jgi:hypothetical protein
MLCGIVRSFALVLVASAVAMAQQPGRLLLRISWGHDRPTKANVYLKLITSSGLQIGDASGVDLERGDTCSGLICRTTAGGGDSDGVTLTLLYPDAPRPRLEKAHIIWSDLIAASDADTAMRLSRDAAFVPGSPKLTLEMNEQETLGFSVTIDQLLTEQAIWVPSLGVYLSAGDRAISYEEHQRQIQPYRGKRILEQFRKQSEPSYESFAHMWEDMGDPSYKNPQQRGPGHIVCLTWDSAIPKFGIDRGAGVWNDYGNPDHFQVWFDFGDLTKSKLPAWKGQKLTDGLPVITTTFERDGTRYDLEQFAYPLDGPPHTRDGDIQMVLLMRLHVVNLTERAQTVPVMLSQRRLLSASDSFITGERNGATVLFRDSRENRVLLTVEGELREATWHGTVDYQKQMKRADATFFLELPPRASRDLIVKLPSPLLPASDASRLAAVDFSSAKATTLKFWSEYVEAGAQFITPEKVVNDLVRASLWHGLRLPRRHGGVGENIKIDLPYSNFAYDQTGTPWPVNQAVYVDYMLYNLRGYHAISTEELLAQFRTNQEPNGHVKGYANWVVYTPGMLYAVAQNYLLSRDRKALDELLPYCLKALDWCFRVIDLSPRSGQTGGLVAGPLNDITGEGLWAFNQAYMFAGLDLFGRVLEAIGNDRGAVCRRTAADIRSATERAFRMASVQSPVVQLRDHTWSPYVPTEASTHRRLLEQWYPTDVDTGPVHLLRLKAISASGDLADHLLNDHEDNLYYKGLGIANEPVYNQQATAYLLRDDPDAAVRTFYSYMASAFSHSALEPVEHRWTHGQYFGPPSTDGAWFELFRNMLVQEGEDGTLLLAQATPRRWLEAGKRIEVRSAPTYYGPLSMTIQGISDRKQIVATVETPTRELPRALILRLRHPEGKRPARVFVNDQSWTDFEASRETVRITGPKPGRYVVRVVYP